MLRHGRAWLAALLFVGAWNVATSAHADFRLWEENADDEWHHRSFSATGYLQAGFLYRQNDADSPSSQDQFWLQRARFGFRAQLHRWLLMRMELETSPAASLTDAYIEAPFSPMLSIRAGQFKVPFMRSVLYSETSLAFIDRPLFTPQSPDRRNFANIYGRDIGFMLTGTFGNREVARHSPAIQYMVGAFLGRGANQIVNDDNAFMYAGRLQFHVFGAPVGADIEGDYVRNDFPRVAVGVGGYTNCDDRGNWNRGWTVDSEFRYRGLFASLAFVRFRNGGVHDSGVGKLFGYQGSCRDGVGGGAAESVAWGVNAQVQYMLPQAFFPFPEQSLELLTRFDAVAPNNPSNGSFLGGGVGTSGYTAPTAYADPDNAPSTWRLTFGVNWFPTSSQIIHLSLNYQLNRETEHVTISSREVIAIKNDILWLQLTAGF